MPNLLIVEDESTFREFMALALSMEGYHVQSVDNGEAAIESLKHDLPDLVMLDLSMPKISGWDILRFIRADPDLKHIPVVIITANADEETRRRSLHERVDKLLIKPVNLDEILDAVQVLLS